MMSAPISIEGEITRVDGTKSKFVIYGGLDGNWQQWGASTEVLGETSDLMSDLFAAALDHLVDRDTEEP